jgi:hypothetical protein
MKENIWIPEEVTEGWSKTAQQGTPKYVHFMYVKVSHTMGQRAHGVNGQCTQNSARKKKMFGNDKLEYFHVHGRITLKVKEEAVPGLRHEGI